MPKEEVIPRVSAQSAQLQRTGNFLIHGKDMNDTEKETCLNLQTAITVLGNSRASGWTVRGLFELSGKMTAGSFGIFLSNTLLAGSSHGRIDVVAAHAAIGSELKARRDTIVTHGTSYKAELDVVRKRTFPAEKIPVAIDMVPEHLLRQGFASRKDQLTHFLMSQKGRPSIVPQEWRR
jgi:hypothetical protein